MATSKKSTTTTRTRATVPAERKPFYAVAGVGDLAVEKLRVIPTQLSKLPTDVSKRTSELQGQAKAFPGQAASQVRGLPGSLTGRASELYDDFASRGEKLVGAINRQPSTARARHAASNAVSRIKGARTATENAVKATAEAADDASGNAASRIKGARTATENAVKATAEAADDAADKVG
jgi:hypothetical protein